MPSKKTVQAEEAKPANQSASTVASDTAVSADDKKKTHVLIVEDDSFLANIYKTKFEMEGFRVSVSDNGEVGLADAQKKKPDIILLDILLPKMDGFVVLEHLRADKDMRNTPVILLTNLGQKDDVEKGLELGASDYLIKAHFKPSETVDKVRKILKEKGKSA